MERHIDFAASDIAGLADRQVIVREDADHTVEVIGLSTSEVATAIGFLSRARQMSGEALVSVKLQLLQTLLAEREPITSGQDILVVQGVVALRTRLLDTPYETYESLSHRRGDQSIETTRTSVRRARDTESLFTVQLGGRTLLPAFQFTDSGRPARPSTTVVRMLRAAGLDGWQLWEWFASPTGWLDGEVPTDLLDTEPELVLEAARQHGEEISLGRRVASQANTER